MTLLSHTWPRGQDINLFLVDDGQIPFDPLLCEIQMLHQADWLRFVAGIPIYYRGRVSEAPDWFQLEGGEVYIQFRSEEHQTRWANAMHKPHFWMGPPEGGLLLFRPEKVISAAIFEGMWVHELNHIFGAEHVAVDSIMQTIPFYLDYGYQGLYQLYDFKTLFEIFGTWPLEYPSTYTYGKQDPDECIIYLPRIHIGGGQYKAVRLFGKNENGWKLTTNALHTRDVPAGPCVSHIQDNVLHTPLRFREQSIQLTADINYTNSRTEFVNVRLDNVGLQEAA